MVGVGSSASQAEIRAAYRIRIRQYHPDKTQGLGPEIRALAERRTKELNAAYARGMQLKKGRA